MPTSSPVVEPSTPAEGAQFSRVSIIIPVCQEPEQYVRKTLEAIEENSPVDILEEVIIVDDASTLPVQDLLAKLHVKMNVRILRNEQRMGVVKSKVKGAAEAKGDVLAFFDAHVRPEPGWLSPLLRHVNINYRRVVVPLVPVLEPETWQSQDGAVGVKMMFDWKLDMEWYEDGNDEVPVLSGGLFVITTRWWRESGGYDPAYETWGGENIEHSLRIWLCGGEIHIARDSRVAHVFRADFPFDVDAQTVAKNKARTVALWLGEKYREKHYEVEPRSRALAPGDEELAEWRKLQEQLQCNTFEWFVKKFGDVFIDKGLVNIRWFMLREGRNGPNCIAATSDRMHLQVAPCDGKAEEQRFAWTSGRHLRNVWARRCFDAGNPRESGHAPILFTCMRSNRNQEWGFSDGRLQWGSYCLDADPSFGGALVMSDCQAESANNWLPKAGQLFEVFIPSEAATGK